MIELDRTAPFHIRTATKHATLLAEDASLTWGW